MRKLNKYKKKKLMKVKPQAEVLAFGAYKFESLQSLPNYRTYTLQKHVLQPEVSASITFFSYIYSIDAYFYLIRVSDKLFGVNYENL